MDYFKNVNDLSGHHVGNKVLIEVASRLSKLKNKNTLLARLSGDEFCILSDNKNDSKVMLAFGNEIVSILKEPFWVNNMSYFLGASIGIAVGPSEISTPELLLEYADLAMYKAKQGGKNKCVIFDESIEKERNYHLTIERNLHYALDNNEISLKYQPKIHLASGKLKSVEVLSRWNQSDLGLVPTDKFIHIAEESGMINEIGEWVLRRSCSKFVEWLKLGYELESLAINVSARQLASRTFSKTVERVIHETGIPAQCIDLEITESAFINDDQILIEELNKLNSLNVQISIDDFGKEYSSLNYLKRVPFDTLKIDREFIIDLENDPRDQHIVNVIVNIGHILGKQIVAEGIETDAQKQILLKHGCDIGQGYLFSKPLTEIEILAFMTDYKKNGLISDGHKVINLQ